MGIANSFKLRGVVLSVLITSLASVASSARQIQFSTSVTAAQGALVAKDLGNDITLPDDATTKQVMAISDLSDRSLKQWLVDRVGFIIGETENAKDKLVQGEKFSYPNSGIFPAFEEPDKTLPKPTADGDRADGSKKVSVVMANVGTSYYYMGKDAGYVIGYKFSSKRGDQVVAITSPRVGIIKVGSGLFGIVPYRQNPASLVNTWFRISTLFHEAHHSDGNGTSLGMPHAVCPKGSVYYNYNACDREGNGPYATGAYMLKMARSKCMADGTCNAGEAEVLANLAADNHSRLLATNFIDPRPEGTVSGANSAN